MRCRRYSASTIVRRLPSVERVRLVVEDERPHARAPEHVEPAVHAGRRRARTRTAARPARPRARRCARRRRLAVGANVPGDVLELGVRHGRVPGADEVVEVRGRSAGRGRPVRAAGGPRRPSRSDGAAEPHPAAGRAHGDGPHARHPLGVVAVRAALEQRERAEREPRDALERRIRHDRELPQARRRGRDRLARALEQRELPFAATSGLRLARDARGAGSGWPRSTRRSTVAAPRSTSTGPSSRFRASSRGRAGSAPSRSASRRSPPPRRRSTPRRSGAPSRRVIAT